MSYHSQHALPGADVPCPICGTDVTVAGYGHEGKPRTYYATCAAENCEGSFEGPSRGSVEEAATALREAIKQNWKSL